MTRIGQELWKRVPCLSVCSNWCYIGLCCLPRHCSQPEAEDPSDGYETVDQEMTARAPHTGRSFVDDRRKVWNIMSNICGKHSCFVYIKPALRNRNGRDAYMLLFDYLIGPNNVVNMPSEEDTKLMGTLYNG
jgi:hypothetical protein